MALPVSCGDGSCLVGASRLSILWVAVQEMLAAVFAILQAQRRRKTDRSVSVSASGYPEFTSLRCPLRWHCRCDHNESSHCHASGTGTIALSVAVRMWYSIHLFSSGFCEWHATGGKTGLVFVEKLRTGARKLLTIGFGCSESVGGQALGIPPTDRLKLKAAAAGKKPVTSFLGSERVGGRGGDIHHATLS